MPWPCAKAAIQMHSVDRILEEHTHEWKTTHTRAIVPVRILTSTSLPSTSSVSAILSREALVERAITPRKWGRGIHNRVTTVVWFGA